MDVQRLCQMDTTLFAVILPIVKGRMFCFSNLFFGFGGLGIFLVSIGLGSNCPFVGRPELWWIHDSGPKLG
jgi:hypothetical protein